jgi:beta-galactosidase
MSSQVHFIFLGLLISAFMLSGFVMTTNAQISYIWKEAETPDKTNFPINISGGPRGEVLSNGKWILQTFSEEEVKAGKLGSGIELSYNINVEQEGFYRFWICLGYESVRAPLMWRLDNSEWHEIPSSDLTQNLIELSMWCEAGWISPAEVNLTSGTHTLELKADRPGSDGRFLFGMDAIAFVQGNWTPEDKIKPNEEPDTEIDLQAKDNVFRFSSDIPKDMSKRVELPLNGVWQVCRHDDPNMDQSPYEPVTNTPQNPHWRGINVPSGLRSIPALDMAHRVWYRCRVEVLESFQGHSFYLDFTGTNWIASVMVNGKLIGSHKSTRIPWLLDITNAVNPGQTNEIMVGIKDIWYAMDYKYSNTTLNKMRNIPVESFQYTRFIAPVYPTTKGDANGMVCGITDPVSLFVTGSVYVSDVFVQTKVAQKRIIADYTLTNTTQVPLEVTLKADAVLDNDRKIEKSLEPKTVLIPANGTEKVSFDEGWADPKLWFPGDDPANMYRLVSTITLDNKPVDSYEQRFGFKEITIDGKYIRVNGIRRNFWNLLDCLKGNTSEEKLAHFRKGNNRFERFSDDLGLRKLLGSRSNQLNWSDIHGIPGRLSTMIDGMFITYDLSNPVTWENFRDHVRQVVLAYRNHPSIIIYSLENELVLINGRLGYGGILDQVEMDAKQMVESARELDPTRPYMLDGAGALKGNLLEINNLHYPEPGTEFFPENAYTLERWGDFGDRWIWDRQRPLAMGETAFFAGKNADHAWIGGDSVFLGRDKAKKAYGKYVRMLLEGYRWNDIFMICPWVGMDEFPECWNAMSPLAAFVREYNTSFLVGEKVIRTVKVFNDTFSEKPLEFSWSVKIGRKEIAGKKQSLKIESGFGKELTIEFTAPTVAKRTEAQLTLIVSRKGDQTYTDTKTIAFFPRITKVPLKKQVYVLENDDKTSKSLLKWEIKANSIKVLSEALPEGIVLIAPDVLTDETSKSDEFKLYTEKGGCIICLEQEHPFTKPAYSVKATDHQANYTFPLGYGNMLFAGLDEVDFSNWAGKSPSAKKIWEPHSVRSWVACGNELNFSAMLEMPFGKGVIIASQMQVGTKLDVEPTAQVLLANMLRYCDSYKPVSNDAFVFAPGKPEIADFMRKSGCNVQETDDLSKVLNDNNTVVVYASKTNLESLISLKAQVAKFTQSGGWIMLWDLEPEGLQAYNKLLGTEHLLREFRLEKVTLVKDVLTSGLGNRDIAQYSKEEIMHGNMWLSQEVFTYCVDGADIAPFCKLPGQKDEPYHPTKDDHDPYNFVNGMTGNEFWKYIVQIWHGDWKPEGSPPFLFGLPVPCKIKTVKIWNNNYYDTIKDMEIQLDGKSVATLELPDALASADANLGVKLAEKDLSLIVRSIRKHQDLPLVGIDNVQIIRELPEWYKKVFPLVNVGGLVRYPDGKGGFILNQIKLTDQDTEENITKKQRIVKTILENIGR